jgi:PAS domain-containing protein
MHKDKPEQKPDLYRWYVALLRADAKSRAEGAALTPVTLVQRDSQKIRTLIAESTKQLAIQPPAPLTLPAMMRALPGGAQFAAKLDEQNQLVESLRVELQQARQGERLIADYTSDLLCCLDERKLIVQVNLQFELTSKYQKLSLIAVPIETILEPENAHLFGPGKFECAIKIADGSFVDLEWTVEYSESAQMYFCRAQNITDRKERERLRKRMASIARHDLRAPLSGIGLCLDNIHLGTYGQISESGMAAVNMAREKIEAMSKLIAELVTSDLKE